MLCDNHSVSSTLEVVLHVLNLFVFAYSHEDDTNLNIK